MGLRRLTFATALLFFAIFPSLAMALDTYEPILPVKYNVESYLAFEDIGKDELAVSTELAFVYGATESLNLTIGLSQSVVVDGSERPNFSTWIGAITNAIDTEIFDMDFMLDFTVGGLSKSPQYGVNPSFEFNFDADPEMLTWGLYARIGMPIYGEREDEALEDGSGKYRFNLDLSFALGCYFMVAENHQILLEQSVSVMDFGEEYGLEPLAVGYNVVLSDNVELITEAAFMLPVNGETFAAHLVIGFLWGL